MKQSEVKVIHSRPVLIQNLVWRTQPTISSSSAESPTDLVFSFYEGKLFRIVVKYDRHEIEGLTADDMIEATSRTYGGFVQNTTLMKARTAMKKRFSRDGKMRTTTSIWSLQLARGSQVAGGTRANCNRERH